MISKITSYSYLRAEGISCCFSITLPTNWFAITQYQLTKARIKLLNYMVTLSKSNEAPWVINSLIKSTCPLCAALKSGVPPSWKRRGTCSGQLHLHNGCWIIKEKYRNNILHEHSFKGNLRSKTHHCFYGIILLIWWKKIFFVQSFDQSSRSYEVTKLWIWSEWRHTRKYTKHFIPGVLCTFLLILWKKNLSHSFMVVLIILNELVKFRRFEWLNCVSR